MIDIYMTNPTNGALSEQEKILPGSWVHLCDPTPEEIGRVSSALSIDRDFLMAALDEEERSRLDIEDGNTLVLVDTPTVETQGPNFVYNTLPFGIILTEDNIVTVCLKEVALPRAFTEGLVKGLNTRKKNRMTLQLLYRNATLFLFYLRQVDKNSTRVENELHISMKNKELIQMLGLEKSLVYFSTALKSNEIVLEKMLRLDFVRDYPEDTELLEDVIIENKQAIEMSNIYRDILSGTMDAFCLRHFEQPQHRHEGARLRDDHPHDSVDHLRVVGHKCAGSAGKLAARVPCCDPDRRGPDGGFRAAHDQKRMALNKTPRPFSGRCAAFFRKFDKNRTRNSQS